MDVWRNWEGIGVHVGRVGGKGYRCINTGMDRRFYSRPQLPNYVLL